MTHPYAAVIALSAASMLVGGVFGAMAEGDVEFGKFALLVITIVCVGALAIVLFA